MITREDLRNQISIFLVGYADAPMQGSDSGLQHESLPMWTLMLIGKIRTPRDEEYILGLQRSSYLEPPLREPFGYWSTSSYGDVLAVIKNQLPHNSKILKQAFYEQKEYRPFFQLTEGSFQKTETLRVALYMHIEKLKSVLFPNSSGLGVYLTKGDLEKITEHIRGKTKKESVYRMKKIGGIETRCRTFTLPSFTIHQSKIEIDLAGDIDDIVFAKKALYFYSALSREKRLARWKKCMERIIG